MPVLEQVIKQLTGQPLSANLPCNYHSNLAKLLKVRSARWDPDDPNGSSCTSLVSVVAVLEVSHALRLKQFYMPG